MQKKTDAIMQPQLENLMKLETKIRNLISETNKKYLIALPVFAGDKKTWNHKTILVSGKNVHDAIAIAKRLRPNSNIGKIAEVDSETLKFVNPNVNY